MIALPDARRLLAAALGRATAEVAPRVRMSARRERERQVAKAIWQYTRPAPDRLVVDGAHLGKTLHGTLHAAPEPLLVTRGFHWINESPFSR